jgi:hypothetical protein
MTTNPSAMPFAADRDPLGQDRPADWSAVESAQTRTLDALAGFEKMAEYAEPGFAPIVEAFRDLHQRHGDRLTRILSDAGHALGSEGSLMGTVNRAVVATRAVFDDIDEDVLKQIHSGEQNVVAAYQDALGAGLPQGSRDEIARMLSELEALLDDTRPVD